MGFSQNSTFGFGSKAVDASGFIIAANEGLSVLGQIVQLGQTLDEAGDPALIDQTRQIPFINPGKILFSLQGTSTDDESISIEPASISVKGQSIIDFQLTGGTNNDISLKAGLNILSATDWGQLNLQATTGTNAASSLAIIPKGTGFGNIASQLMLFGSDFIADSTNYSAFYILAQATQTQIISAGAGTGTAKKISFSVGTNTQQFVLSTDGNIGMSAGLSPLAKLHITNSVTGSSSNGTILVNTTWNTTGAPTAFFFNVSQTASDAASLIMDIQLSGSSVHNIDKNGTATLSTRSLGAQAFGNLVITPQWNTSGSPTVVLVNPTNTASGASATLLDLQVSSVSKFKVDKNGTATLTSSLTGSANARNLVINPTWNTTGAPIAILINVTDTASSVLSNLMDLQVASLSKFRIRKNGNVTVSDGILLVTSTSTGSNSTIGLGSISTTNRDSTAQGQISTLNDLNIACNLGVRGSTFVGATNVAFISTDSANMQITVQELNFITTRVQIGNSNAPTAILQLAAGTASASSAPLKFTSGTNLTVPENGTMEYNGTNLFFTRTGATRESVFVGNDGAAAPGTTGGGAPTTFYGTGGTNFLSTPNNWASVVVNGTTYKIPLYT